MGHWRKNQGAGGAEAPPPLQFKMKGGSAPHVYLKFALLIRIRIYIMD